MGSSFDVLVYCWMPDVEEIFDKSSQNDRFTPKPTNLVLKK